MTRRLRQPRHIPVRNLPAPPAPEIIMMEPELVVRQTRDLVRSQHAAETARAQPNDCYRNAFMGMHIPGRADSLLYVEGWVFDPEGWVHDHAWIEDRDGLVIEPTLLHIAHTVHFPVFRWSYAQVQAAIDVSRQMTLWLRFDRGSRERAIFMDRQAAVWQWVLSHGKSTLMQGTSEP